MRLAATKGATRLRSQDFPVRFAPAWCAPSGLLATQVWTRFAHGPSPQRITRLRWNLVVQARKKTEAICGPYIDARFISLLHSKARTPAPVQTPPNGDEADHSVAMLGAILDSLSDVVVVLDAIGVIVVVNKSWRKYSLDNAPASGAPTRGTGIGDNFLAVFEPRPGYIPDGLNFRTLQGIRAVLDGSLAEFENEVPCDLSMQERSYAMRVTTLAPRGSGAVIAYTDITERKRAQVEKAKREELELTVLKNESLNRLAGAVAHHFSNQLQTVMLKLEMATSQNHRSEDLNKTLTSALQAARKAAMVSSQIRVYTGQAETNPESLDLAAVCRGHLEQIRSTLPQGVTLEIDLPSPGPNIVADPDQLRELLSNLITNAWEAGGNERGAIRVSLKTATAAEIPAGNRFPVDWQLRAPDYACLEVADLGCGIAPSDIAKVFDPFYSTKFHGRGLGLPVVLGILLSHRGVITVTSELGQGSVFRVYYPMLKEAMPLKQTPPVQLAPPRHEVKPCTVLVVEDNRDLRETLAMAFESYDFSVLTAADGVEAMELFHQHRDKIGCVLCDVSMPRMNGWETLAALRQIAPELPVILNSGHTENKIRGDRSTGLSYAFLQKPFDLEACIAMVRRLTR